MDIPVNARVSCVDEPYGRVTSVILKPNTGKMTHIVVRCDSFPETEYMVPIDRIIESDPDGIRLNCTREDMEVLPVFNKVEFIPSEISGFSGGPYMMWPYYMATPGIPIEVEGVPEDEMAIRRGATVEAVDGDVGHVDEFLLNPSNDHISHLVMREGHLWGQKDVTIPMSQIDRFENNTVYLKLSKEDIGKLPSVPVRRNWTKNDE